MSNVLFYRFYLFTDICKYFFQFIFIKQVMIKHNEKMNFSRSCHRSFNGIHRVFKFIPDNNRNRKTRVEFFINLCQPFKNCSFHYNGIRQKRIFATSSLFCFSGRPFLDSHSIPYTSSMPFCSKYVLICSGSSTVFPSRKFAVNVFIRSLLCNQCASLYIQFLYFPIQAV